MACRTRHFFIIPLLLLVNTMNGQNISRYYTSSLQEKGTLFYILPQKGFESNNKNNFIYDMSYQTQNDTVTVNFSYFDRMNLILDSISLSNGNQQVSSDAEKLYIETKKSKWHYRYSSKFLFTDIASYFDQTEPPTVIIYYPEGSVEVNIKAKTWRKQSALIKKILTLIEYNK